MIGDTSMNEKMREVISPEMAFCKEHNRIMYPKSTMIKALSKATMKNILEFLSKSSNNKESLEKEAEEEKPNF